MPEIIVDEENKKFIEFLKKFNESGEGGLLIMGKRGLGKTFLCKNIITHDYFIDESDFMQHQKNGMIRLKLPEEYSQSSRIFPLEMLSKARIIIYDDFGTGSLTEAYITNMLYWLNRRIEKGLKTIITTNLSEKEILERESRIGSRIFELCNRLEVSGNDRRMKKSKKITL